MTFLGKLKYSVFFATLDFTGVDFTRVEFQKSTEIFA